MLKTQKEKKLENNFSNNNKTQKKKNIIVGLSGGVDSSPVSYTHLRAHETGA